MKTYEFQAFRNGRWEIQGSFDSREEALSEARRAVDDNRYPGIRVTEEVYNEDRNLTKTRSIFSYEYNPALDRSGREEKKLTNLRKLRSRLRRGRRQGLAGAEELCEVAPTQGFGVPILYLFVILLLGVFSLIALHTLFKV